MNKTTKKIAKKVSGKTANYTTVAANIGRLANGSYLARKTVNGKRIGLCFTTMKAAKAWLTA